MTTAIESPVSPLLPPATNEFYIADSWTTSLESPPVFSTELRFRDGDTYTPLGGENVSMTEAQWAKWPEDADDREYILNCITQNRGLVRA